MGENLKSLENDNGLFKKYFSIDHGNLKDYMEIFVSLLLSGSICKMGWGWQQESRRSPRRQGQRQGSRRCQRD
jgi:hypothetical protein